MMMVPYMFNDGLMDNLFSNDWEHDFERAMRAAEPRNMFGKHAANVMKTDVRETKDGYDVFVDLPGFKKDEIQVHLENGYLTVSAEKHADKQAGKGKYLRQERYSGTVSRTFYVGDALKPDDVKAKYEDGVLVVSLSKKAPEAIEQRSQIAIEG